MVNAQWSMFKGNTQQVTQRVTQQKSQTTDNQHDTRKYRKYRFFAQETLIPS